MNMYVKKKCKMLIVLPLCSESWSRVLYTSSKQEYHDLTVASHFTTRWEQRAKETAALSLHFAVHQHKPFPCTGYYPMTSASLAKLKTR